MRSNHGQLAIVVFGDVVGSGLLLSLFFRSLDSGRFLCLRNPSQYCFEPIECDFGAGIPSPSLWLPSSMRSSKVLSRLLVLLSIALVYLKIARWEHHSVQTFFSNDHEAVCSVEEVPKKNQPAKS